MSPEQLTRALADEIRQQFEVGQAQDLAYLQRLIAAGAIAKDTMAHAARVAEVLIRAGANPLACPALVSQVTRLDRDPIFLVTVFGALALREACDPCRPGSGRSCPSG